MAAVFKAEALQQQQKWLLTLLKLYSHPVRANSVLQYSLRGGNVNVFLLRQMEKSAHLLKLQQKKSLQAECSPPSPVKYSGLSSLSHPSFQRFRQTMLGSNIVSLLLSRNNKKEDGEKK